MKKLQPVPAVPQVSGQPTDELDEFLQAFRIHFKRRESTAAFEHYLIGLLSEHPNKNADTLGRLVPGSSEQELQGLATRMVWDEQDLNRQRLHVMRALPTEGDAVILCDDTGFAKQGRSSVGVQRQYSGTLGRVGNCQVTVNCHYAERTLAWPIASRLYLPQVWCDDAARRRKAHVPDTVQFQTKAEIALDLIDEARAAKLPHACLVCDADYGDNPAFLDGLAQRRERCVVAVRADFQVARRRGGDSAQRVDAALSALPRQQWRAVAWRAGSQGWLSAKFARVRCWRVDGAGHRTLGWLLGQRPSAGRGDWKYYWSSFGAHVQLSKLVEYAHRRYWVEQFHEEAKGLLGWDQYQGRLWTGFHRNAILVMLSYSFLVWLEWHQRQLIPQRGRPRRAFSPSARSAAPIAGRHPSPGR